LSFPEIVRRSRSRKNGLGASESTAGKVWESRSGWQDSRLAAAGMVLPRIPTRGPGDESHRLATGIFLLPEVIPSARPCASELLGGHGVGPDIAGRSS